MKKRNGSATWQLQEAKNRFSEVVRKSQKDGPQTITVHGEEAAVLISVKEYRKMRRKKPSLAEFLLNSPMRGCGFEIERIRMPVPPPIEF